MTTVLKYLLKSPGGHLSRLWESSVFLLLHRGPFHAALASHARACFSTGCHRRTCGQASKVERRVMIAPSLETTGVAGESPLRQGQRLLDDAAARAGLA